MKTVPKTEQKRLSEGMKRLGRRLAAQDGDTAEVSAKALPRGYFLENYYTGIKRGQIKRLFARKKAS
jgi:hypothetical protein